MVKWWQVECEWESIALFIIFIKWEIIVKAKVTHVP